MIWPSKGNDKGKVAARRDDVEPPPPSYDEASSSSRLPIVIPQSTVKPRHAYIAPFVRAAPPSDAMARHYGLSSDGFLGFVDAVNRACTAPAALQAVRLTDSLTNVPPFGVLKSVSMALNSLAGASGRASGYTRTLTCVRKANDDLFAPRGLHACIVSTSKLIALLDASTPNGGQQRDLGPPPADERLAEMHATLQGRRVAALQCEAQQSSIAPSVFDKANAWQAQKDEQRKQARDGKRREQRRRRRRDGDDERRWLVVYRSSAAQTTEEDVDLGSEHDDDDDDDDDDTSVQKR